METRSQKRQKVYPPSLAQGKEREIKVMKKALRNPLIIQKIVDPMDNPQLLVCRVINQTWKLMATEVIKKRDSCSIEVDCDHKKSSREKVEAFDKMLSNSQDFPCSSFHLYILEGGKEIPKQVEIVFGHHGSKMKTLHLLIPLRRDSQKAIFFQVLSSAAPTLENLELYTKGFNWPSNFEFPSLKYLECSSSFDMIEILRVAPNLKTIHFYDGVNEGILNELQKCGRLDLIKEARTSKLLKNWFNFQGLKLQKLDIRCINEPELEEKMKIEKILEWNKNSLKHLILEERFCPTIFIPKLPHLKTLELISRQNFLLNDPPVLRKVILLVHETFPNLQILNLTDVSLSQDENWAVLPSHFYRGNLPSVKKIQLRALDSESCLTQLMPLCPNFIQLEIHCGIQNPFSDTNSEIKSRMLPRVFKLWPQLTELTLICVNISAGQQFCMDSVLTGMQEETCEQLRSLNSEEREENWQNLVTGPSLRDLKGLKRFTIELCKNSYLAFSRVSGIYSFKMMPNLKVKLILKSSSIGFDVLTEELGSFVNFQH